MTDWGYGSTDGLESHSSSNHFSLHASFVWRLQTACWLTKFALALATADTLLLSKWFLQTWLRYGRRYDLIWLNLSTIQAPNPMQLLENKHHMKIITSWHHAAEISSLHRQTDMADREGSDNTTNVSLSFARVRILKCELCPCTVMKKAQLEEWISSPWNKSPGRKIICLCASNNPSQPCLLTAPHLLLLPCLSCKLGELHGRGPHCLLTNTPFSRLGPHWWIIQALPSALLRFLIKVRR